MIIFQTHLQARYSFLVSAIIERHLKKSMDTSKMDTLDFKQNRQTNAAARLPLDKSQKQ